jgi:transposase
MELSEILRRKQDGQSISEISRETGRDRKTIRKYICLVEQESIAGKQIAGKQEVVIPVTILQSIVEKTRKPSDKQKIFEPYLEEIKQLLFDEKIKLKIKSVYEVTKKRHDIKEETSLSSFKRFIKANNLRKGNFTTCRIEQAPGHEIQVDYATVGRLINPLTGRKTTVYAFIGTLCSSRHKYAEFVFKQDQRSFVESHVKMFRFFGGLTKTITLDNLKAGVIKPDLYEPKINRSYAEMAEHYGCFINPCRVASPKDKGKVERDVQTIREEFTKMFVLNPSITVTEANYKIKDWLINEYGKRKHGTTQLKPYDFFKEVESPCLIPLPFDEFEIAQWKQAKVHPDCFIQVNKKSYSVPYQYVGKTLTVKVKSKLVEIYYNEQMIKEHLIPKNNRQTDYADFPENVEKALSGNLQSYLIREAERLGSKPLKELLEKLLTPHAFINLRRAQGIISVAKNYSSNIVQEAAVIALRELTSYHPKEFKRIIIKLLSEEQEQIVSEVYISEMTQQFVRPMNYFINNNE